MHKLLVSITSHCPNQIACNIPSIDENNLRYNLIYVCLNRGTLELIKHCSYFSSIILTNSTDTSIVDLYV